LLESARPAKVLSLIVSDVIGDDLSVIGSGPTVPDGSTFAECLGIIDKYRIADQLPPEVTAYLRRGAAGFAPETPKHPALFAGASHHLIATNALAIEAVRRAAEALTVEVEVLGSTLSGEARELAKTLADQAKARRRSPRSRPLLLLGGGETTVRLRGDGKGGRNQELALALAVELDGLPGVHVLCAGTDGTDGPTAAAGAFADGGTVEAAKSRGLSAVAHLRNNDSHPFFKAIDSLLITGPTLTNVMDLVLILVEAGDVPVKR
jgi:hydroxypyruvate reductase